ncbi:MAG: DNA-3-methyladenine glycosylase family protein, partial [Acutalibacteraceae bacterium]
MTDIEFKNNNVYIKSNSFDLRQTLDCGQAFRYSVDENGVWKGVAKGRVITLYKENDIIVIENMDKEEFEKDFYRYFTFDVDYDAVKKCLSADETLKKAVECSPGIRILRQDKFETVCSFIFSQNNNIPRIKGIIERFCENFGEKIDEGYYDFPTAKKIASLTVEDLAPIRAGFRAKYIIDAAKKVYSGEVNLQSLETMPIEQAREELMKV